MIVTCSNCEARYAVDPLAIGPNGRTVQCARCNHRWFQKVEGPRPPPDLVIRPPERGVSLPVPVAPNPEPVWGKRLAIAAGVLVLLGAAGIAAYQYRDELSVYRDKIVAFLPAGLRSSASGTSNSSPRAPNAKTAIPAPAPSASSGAAAEGRTKAPVASNPRLDSPATPAQLQVDLSASKIELVDGRYVVRGEIANHGGTSGSISKLVVTFKKGNDVLGTRTYPLTLGPIAAGERKSFSQTLDNPPAGATDIVPSVE
jgi:predicted Zn finger-like uncharacterized protein